ncbi:MAG: AraC family transcriptional regulator [Sporocytophaga sp.]|uniref:AraC family transcriptional regulator n=1 Tax=Sporocytophaga sp. TaxID=2231183 RepID=UPI001B201E6F|nr:AraC family transcriptional regulator [Sporocytophaga sp.]MBO9703320.1 AraC family transcriptional regulator [Sporocytophaga sp.]
MKTPKEDFERINRVIRFIDKNLLNDLSLDNLAEVANYSPFHFQRIFKSIKGETPKQYIKRLRLEKAAHLIVLFPEKTILEVAFEVGFKSLEVFSRAFKDYYQTSPDNFRKKGEEEKIKIIQHPHFSFKFLESSESFLPTFISPEEFEHLNIKVINRPSQKLVYYQSTIENPDQIMESFGKIKQWATNRTPTSTDRELIGILKDYPIFTPLDKCRYYVCASVNEPTAVSGLVNYLEVPQGKYAEFQVTGGISEIMKACAYFVHYWLPESGYNITHEYLLQVPLHDPCQTLFADNTYRIFINISAV